MTRAAWTIALGTFFCLFFYYQSDRLMAQPSSAVISGRVEDVQTGKPLSNVNIVLKRTVTTIPTSAADFQKLKQISAQEFTSATDNEGRFEIVDVPPGTYLVEAALTGYGVQRGFNPTRNISGGTKDTIAIPMVRSSVVSGLVEDAEGDPLGGVTVQVVMSRVQGGSPALITVSRTVTSTAGTFSFPKVVPGVYFLQAGYPKPLAPRPGDEPSKFADTFYPRASELEAAVPVTVQGGLDLAGLRITMGPERTFTVKGEVLGELPVPAASTTAPLSENGGKSQASSAPSQSVVVELQRVSRLDNSLRIPGLSPLGIRSPLKPDQTYDLSRVPEGTYVVRLLRGPSVLNGSRVLTVTGDNVQNFDIVVPRTFPVRGRLAVENGERPERFQVLLWEAEMDGASRRLIPVDISETGAFEVSSLALGWHRISLGGQSRLVVSSVTVGSRSFTGGAFEITGSAEEVRVILTGKAGTIRGRLEPSNQADLVALTATPLTILESTTLSATEVTADGEFSVSGLEPGRYRVCAWDGDRDRALTLQVSKHLESRLDSACETVDLDTGGATSVSLKGIAVSSFN